VGISPRFFEIKKDRNPDHVYMTQNQLELRLSRFWSGFEALFWPVSMSAALPCLIALSMEDSKQLWIFI